MRLALSLLLAFIIHLSSSAVHITGGDITWNCLGNDQYATTLMLISDCSGVPLPNSYSLTLLSSCGNGSVPLVLQNPGGTETTELCASELPNSSCSGGSLPGFRVFYYTGVVTLVPCISWTMEWSICCRGDAANLDNPFSSDVYLAAELNTLDYPCNSSVDLVGRATPFACINEQAAFSIAAIDPDRDSLLYELVSARQAAASPIPYVLGYSGADPTIGASIDANSGLVTFIPSQLGSFVFVVKVSEFDNVGNLKSTVFRDFKYQVLNCSAPNAPAVFNTGHIANLSGDALQIDSVSLEVCQGNSFCYDFTINDLNTADSLVLVSHADLALPGSVLTFSGSNPITAELCWTAPNTMEGEHQVTVSAWDNVCPTAAVQDFVFNIRVVPSITASVSVSGNVFTANQSGGTYQWLDCNNALSPIPGATGQSYTAASGGYVAVMISSGGCVDTSACVQVVGIDELSADPFALYPNPATDKVVVELENISRADSELSIYDPTGKLVFSHVIPAGSRSAQLSTSALASGIYTLSLKRNERIYSEHLVITP